MTENIPTPAEHDAKCSNPECPLARPHSGPCAPKDWRGVTENTPTRANLIADALDVARWAGVGEAAETIQTQVREILIERNSLAAEIERIRKRSRRAPVQIDFENLTDEDADVMTLTRVYDGREALRAATAAGDEIELCAIRMCEASEEHWGWGYADDDEKENWRTLARAALSADVVAARDARVLDRIIRHLRSTVRLGLGLTEEQKQDRRNIIEWLEADRIEREAQR